MKLHVKVMIASLLAGLALVVIPHVSLTQPPPPAVSGGSIEEQKTLLSKKSVKAAANGWMGSMKDHQSVTVPADGISP